VAEKACNLLQRVDPGLVHTPGGAVVVAAAEVAKGGVGEGAGGGTVAPRDLHPPERPSPSPVDSRRERVLRAYAERVFASGGSDAIKGAPWDVDGLEAWAAREQIDILAHCWVAALTEALVVHVIDNKGASAIAAFAAVVRRRLCPTTQDLAEAARKKRAPLTVRLGVVSQNERAEPVKVAVSPAAGTAPAKMRGPLAQDDVRGRVKRAQAAPVKEGRETVFDVACRVLRERVEEANGSRVWIGDITSGSSLKANLLDYARRQEGWVVEAAHRPGSGQGRPPYCVAMLVNKGEA